MAGARGTKQKRNRVRSNGNAVEETRDVDMITEGNARTVDNHQRVWGMEVT